MYPAKHQIELIRLLKAALDVADAHAEHMVAIRIAEALDILEQRDASSD